MAVSMCLLRSVQMAKKNMSCLNAILGRKPSRESCFCPRKKGRETAQRVVQLHYSADFRSREKLYGHH